MNKIKLLVAALVIGIVSFFGINRMIGENATALNMAARDCNGNSVIYCGAINTQELKEKYAANATGDLPALLAHFGISGEMVNGMTAKAGHVTRTGDVVVDGKVVATGASSVGRENGDGSGTPFSVGDRQYFLHPSGGNWMPGVEAIGALVWLDANGQYVAGIMTACGNPLSAIAVPVPVYRCDSLVAKQLSRNQFNFTTNATAQGGATITGYTYNFGDGNIVRDDANVTHVYAKPGTYNVTVTVHINTGTAAVDVNCTAQVTVTPEMCPVPGKEHLPKDDPGCFEDKPGIVIEKTVHKKDRVYPRTAGATANEEHAKVGVNEEFFYYIVVKNTGNIPLVNAVVTDKAPAEVVLTRAEVGTIKNNVWTYTIPKLEVGKTVSFTVYAKYAKYATGTHKNTVCVDTPTVPGGPDDCDDATTETTEDITVCDTRDNTIKTIERSEFDGSYMTTDQSKCAPTPPPAPPTPTELPKTGVGESIGSIFGLGSLAGVGYAYAASRRSIR